MLNKVIMMGNLTRDPEMSYTPSGTPICKFGIACNKKFKGADGQSRDKTCFVDCCIMGKRAEVVQKYFHRGEPIIVEGELQFDQWEKDGVRRSKHCVNVSSFEFVGGNRQGNQQGQQPQNNATQGGYQQGGQQPQGNQGYNNQGYQQQGNQQPVNAPPANPPMQDDSFDMDDVPF